MSKVFIKPDSVIYAASSANNAKNVVENVRATINKVMTNLDPQVKSYYNINARANSINRSLAISENEISSIVSCSNNAAKRYKHTDEQLNQMRPKTK